MVMDISELLSKVNDESLREQLKSEYDALAGSALRQKLEGALDELRTVKAEKRRDAYKKAGLAEEAFETFDSLYDGELDVDKIREAATSKGFAVGSGAPSAPEGPAGLSSGEQRLAAVQAGALPPRDPSLKDEADKADAEGDHQTANRKRAQMLMKASRG